MKYIIIGKTGINMARVDTFTETQFGVKFTFDSGASVSFNISYEGVVNFLKGDKTVITMEEKK